MAPVWGEQMPCNNSAGDNASDCSGVMHTDTQLTSSSRPTDTQQSSSSPPTVLADELFDQSLLRGVCASLVLNGGVSAFTTETGGISATQEDYSLSVPVPSIDDFISHDWASRPWTKAMALLVCYNGNAAIFASMVIALMLSFLQWYFAEALVPAKSERVLSCSIVVEIPVGIWSTLVSPAVFLVILLSWQKVLSLWMTPRKLFVDRFCVDQVDEQRKTQAILGLAGFLNRSRRLVVCWTPCYFSRLWTVYEIASWHHLKGSSKDVVFLLVAQTEMMLYAMLVLTLCLWSRIVSNQLVDAASIVPYVVAGVILVASGSFLSYHLLRQVKDINALPHQLAKFSVRQAQCFCCSNSHMMPDTGLSIRCDRQLVYRKLTERYLNKFGDLSDIYQPRSVQTASSCHGTQPEEPEHSDELKEVQTKLESGSVCMHRLSQTKVLQAAALDEFDSFVHTEAASDILRSFGHNGLSYHQILYAAAPLLWSTCDFIPAARNLEKADLFFWFMIGRGVDFALVLPAFFGLFYKGLLFMERQRQDKTRSRVQAATFHLIAPSVTLSLTWVLGRFLNGWVEQRLPYLAFSGGLVLLNMGLFNKLFCRGVAAAACKRNSSCC